MSSLQPWKTDAMVRLLVCIFLCFFSGSLLLALMHHARTASEPGILAFVVGGVTLLCLAVNLVLVQNPWPAERLMPWLGLTVFLFYASLLLGAWVMKLTGGAKSSVLVMIVAALTFQGAVLVLLPGFLREHGLGWSEAFGFRNEPRRAILAGLILASLFLPIGWGLQWVSNEVMLRLPLGDLRPTEQQTIQTLRTAYAWTDRVVLGAITVLLAPVGEELLFRGLLYPWIKRIGFPRLALWSTSLLFAAVHFNMATFLPLLILALALVAIYEWTDNLVAPIVAHALFNAFNFVLLYALQSPPA